MCKPSINQPLKDLLVAMACRNGVCVCVCLEGVGHCLLGAQEKKHIAKHGFFFQFCDLKNSANISNKKKSNIS
jgi:hypothetical protein